MINKGQLTIVQRFRVQDLQCFGILQLFVEGGGCG